MGQLAIRGGNPVRTTPFHPWHIHSEDEISLIREVLQSDIWGGFFPFHFGEGGEPRTTKTEEFEKRFTSHHDCRFGACTSSGTIALETAVRAVGVGEGDEVIVPTIASGCNALLDAAWGVRAIPVFVDIEPSSYCIDPVKVEKAITERTGAIIPVHFGGYMADMDHLLHLAQENNIAIVEDACQAHGGRFKGKSAGSFGDIGCFSFQDFKLMTSGEGGIAITNNAEYVQTCHSFVNSGRNRLNDVYEEKILGHNYRLTEIQAAILLAQLGRLSDQTRKRGENAHHLSKGFSEIDGVEPLKSTPEQAYYYYVFRYDKSCFNNAPLDVFVEALWREGIPAKRIIPPEYLFLVADPYYPEFCNYYGRETEKAVNAVKKRSAVAIEAYEESVWIHHSILLGSKSDMNDIVAAVDKIRKHSKELNT